MVIDVKPLQSENASAPIEVTELGMVIDVNFDKPRQRFAGILWTLSPIVKDVRLPSGQTLSLYDKTSYDKSLQFSALKITDVKP